MLGAFKWCAMEVPALEHADLKCAYVKIWNKRQRSIQNTKQTFSNASFNLKHITTLALQTEHIYPHVRLTTNGKNTRNCEEKFDIPLNAAVRLQRKAVQLFFVAGRLH